MKKRTFQDFKLSEEILSALKALNYQTPTDVQSTVIPLCLENKDLLVRSQTGSGKTAAFAIPISENINWLENNPQALVLTPTRELAVQIKEDFSNIGRFKRVKAVAVFGKQSVSLQQLELKQKTHVVVGTPGRVIDHIQRKNLVLDQIRYLVIDEADEMLHMGFIDQVEAIINELPKERVTLLFSATMPDDIKELATRYMKHPYEIDIKSITPIKDKIDHFYYQAEDNGKLSLLKDVTIIENPESCIIFCETKDKVDEIYRNLEKAGYSCGKIHGGLKQETRLLIMRDYKLGKFRYLVATDVASRGIDIDNISLVIQYDIPFELETYVHRTGRTGRAGNKGKAITILSTNEINHLHEIEEYLGIEIQKLRIPKKEDILKLKPAFNEKMKKTPQRKQSKDEQLNKQIMKLFFNGGKKKKLRAVDFVGTIVNIDGVEAEDIGTITILETSTFVDILNGKGPLVLKAMKNKTIKGKLLKVYQAKED